VKPRVSTPQFRTLDALKGHHKLLNWGVPQPPSSHNISSMYISRIYIRKFIDSVEWSTVRNIIILANGRYISHGSAVIRNELEKMTRTKRIPPLRKLHDQGKHAVFGSSYTKKKDVGNHQFLHDNHLRDCLPNFFMTAI
jgi:hypothetical protein